LLGYVLLDYSDLYRISAVGLYFARQATLVWWPLDQFLFLLGGESVPELDVLRREFKLALKGPYD
jgi:hypothetical protein